MMPSDNAPVDTIICGDNVEVMRRLIPDESIDMVLTSPPYDNYDGKITHPNGLRTYDGYTWDFELVTQEIWRVLKPGAVCVWVVGDATVNGSETGSSFRQALYFMGLGFRLHDTMIWNKGGFTAVGSLMLRYAPVFEYMFILSKGTPKIFNPIIDRINKNSFGKFSKIKRISNGEMRDNDKSSERREIGQRFNIWNMSSETSDFHSAPFPEALAHDHIISWSQPGDVVLDPFVGSGTVPKMAHILNRRYIGIDCSPRYVELAKRRVGNVEREMRGEWKPLASTPGELDGLPMWEGME